MKIMINHNAHEVVEELFESLCIKYQNNMEKLIRRSEFTLIRLTHWIIHAMK